MTGLVLLILVAGLEVILAITGRGKEKEKRTWLKNRLLVRILELVIVVAAMLLVRQNWRLVPVLGFVAILGLIALVRWLLGRRKEGVRKKAGPAVASCILSIVFIGLLLVPAILFTGYSGLPVSGQHPIAQASAILVDGARTDPFEQDGSCREVPVYFYFPADAADGEQFPLVVFSHGAFGYYQSNTSTYMELASNGYVVVALDHPHHAFFTRDTDGRLVLFDQDFFRTASTLGDPNDDAERYFAIFRDWMDLRTGDMNFVLDSLEAAGSSASLDDSWFLSGSDADTVLSVLKMTDLTKIGLMGHSMGGATAVQLGRERSDISAVIDLDGTMLGEYLGVENGRMTVSEEPYALPVLEFNNWESYNERKEYLAQGYRYPNDELISHAEDGYSVTVRDTLHMDYTDLPLFSPTLGKLFGSGERDSAETMSVVNSLVLDFFNHYLKGEGAFSAQEIY